MKSSFGKLGYTRSRPRLFVADGSCPVIVSTPKWSRLVASHGAKGHHRGQISEASEALILDFLAVLLLNTKPRMKKNP